jgi:hypothetical protein
MRELRAPSEQIRRAAGEVSVFGGGYGSKKIGGLLQTDDEPMSPNGRLMIDRGDFRGLGDQASAAERSYSACAALSFFRTRLRTMFDLGRMRRDLLYCPVSIVPFKIAV